MTDDEARPQGDVPPPIWPYPQPYGNPYGPRPPSGSLPGPGSASTASSPPPLYPPAYPLSSPSAAPRRGGRVVVAALLVGALAGGMTGIGAATLISDNGSAASGDGLVHADNSNGSGSPASTASDVTGTPEAAAARVLPSVVKIYASGQLGSGSGSGIVLTPGGQILTNNHVVELAVGGGRLAVSFNDGATARATIVGRDPLTDIAVIQAVGVSSLNPATLGSSAGLRVGQQVVAVGAPFGLESTVTDGIVSALDRPVRTQGEAVNDPTTIFPAIQTDAAINPGNSGGPLVNLAGQVVGINAAIYSNTSGVTGQGGSIGLGFAIPIDEAIPVADQLRNGQTPTHARVGVNVSDAKDSLGLPAGALVEQVDGGTPAAEAGIQKGDVVTKVDDNVVTDADSLVATVRTYRPGDTVTLTVTSSNSHGQPTGGSHTVRIKLGSDAD